MTHKQTSSLLRTARILDKSGRHAEADKADAMLRRLAQFSALKQAPTGSGVGNALDNTGNAISGWWNGLGFNHNGAGNMDKVWEHAVGFAQELNTQAQQLPPQVKSALINELNQVAQLVAPVTQSHRPAAPAAKPAAPAAQKSASLRFQRLASVTDVSGLTRMVKDFTDFTESALKNYAPNLTPQFTVHMGNMTNILNQWASGDSAGAAVTQVGGATGQPIAPTSVGTAAPASPGMPTSVSAFLARGPWASNPSGFLQKCKEIATTQGKPALQSHLQQGQAPADVAQWALSQV